MDASTQPPVIRLHPEDGVVIARQVLPPGTPVAPNVLAADPHPGRAQGGGALPCTGRGGTALRPDHRLRDRAGDARPMGAHPQPGDGRFLGDYAWGVDAKPTEPAAEPASFQGIRRADGRVATRNYIGIVTSVNCSAHVAELIAQAFRRNPINGDDPLAEWPNVDGVVALTHKTGCGMTAGEPLTLLRRTLGGFARHANFSNVIAIGLGCEVNQIGGAAG